MTTIVLLNNVDHADLSVRIGPGGAFGAEVNQVPLVPTEIDDAQRDYPIVLRNDPDGKMQLVALLGLDRNENLFLDGDRWSSRYIPVLLQCGPFRIGLQQQREEEKERPGEPMIHVDLDHPAVGRGTDGEPLFLPHGGTAPYLDHVVRVLRRLHDGSAVAAPMIAAWDEAGLIEPIQLRITLDETTRYDVPDCFTVSPERLAGLDGAALERLNRSGFLKPAFMLAASLGNVTQLIDRKNARRARAAGEQRAAAGIS